VESMLRQAHLRRWVAAAADCLVGKGYWQGRGPAAKQMKPDCGPAPDVGQRRFVCRLFAAPARREAKGAERDSAIDIESSFGACLIPAVLLGTSGRLPSQYTSRLAVSAFELVYGCLFAAVEPLS